MGTKLRWERQVHLRQVDFQVRDPFPLGIQSLEHFLQDDRLHLMVGCKACFQLVMLIFQGWRRKANQLDQEDQELLPSLGKHLKKVN